MLNEKKQENPWKEFMYSKQQAQKPMKVQGRTKQISLLTK